MSLPPHKKRELKDAPTEQQKKRQRNMSTSITETIIEFNQLSPTGVITSESAPFISNVPKTGWILIETEWMRYYMRTTNSKFPFQATIRKQGQRNAISYLLMIQSAMPKKIFYSSLWYQSRSIPPPLIRYGDRVPSTGLLRVLVQQENRLFMPSPFWLPYTIEPDQRFPEDALVLWKGQRLSYRTHLSSSNFSPQKNVPIFPVKRKDPISSMFRFGMMKVMLLDGRMQWFHFESPADPHRYPDDVLITILCTKKTYLQHAMAGSLHYHENPECKKKSEKLKEPLPAPKFTIGDVPKVGMVLVTLIAGEPPQWISYTLHHKVKNRDPFPDKITLEVAGDTLQYNSHAKRGNLVYDPDIQWRPKYPKNSSK